MISERGRGNHNRKLTDDLATLQIEDLTIVGDFRWAGRTVFRWAWAAGLIAAADGTLAGRAGLADRGNALAWRRRRRACRARAGGGSSHDEASAEEHSEVDDGELHVAGLEV